MPGLVLECFSLSSPRRHLLPRRMELQRFVPRPSKLVTSEQLIRLAQAARQSQRLLVITGAGVSTESGVPDYRSEHVGLYARKQHKPVQHADFVNSAAARRSYWARNFVGWPQFSQVQPNFTHKLLVEWETSGRLHWLVTQNVDALHTKAGSRRMCELHGCSHRIVCLKCGDRSSRHHLQPRLAALNQLFNERATEVAPDGDVILRPDQVAGFQVAACERCGGLLKPDVVFFGDTVPKATVEQVREQLHESDQLLVLGSSLQTFSSYRIVLEARERGVPVAIVNIGPTRADHLCQLKLEGICSEILAKLAT